MIVWFDEDGKTQFEECVLCGDSIASGMAARDINQRAAHPACARRFG